jgi:hypothetical protein
MVKNDVVKRFIFFPLFFPKTIRRIIDSRDKPSYYDEFGVDITSSIVGSVPVVSVSNSLPQADFNSPTTATVKPFVVVNDLPSDPVSDPVSLGFSLSCAYCLKCKCKVEVLDPSFYSKESRRGIRRYLSGVCSVCKSKINAIVKGGS